MRWRTPAVILVCGGLILMLALGTRQSFGLFLRPMTIDLGGGREVFSFAIALQNLVWGLGMPLAGAIADRHGAGRVLALGGLAYGLGLIAMAHSATPLELNATAGVLIGLGLACTGFGVVLAVVARAFPPESRSFAVGITGACGSIGQFVMLPGGQALLSSFGWVNALVVLGAAAFLIIPLGAALAGRNPAAHESEQSIGEALAEAMHHRGFWLLTGSFFVCGFQTIFVMTHLPAYAVDRGLTPTQGMNALPRPPLARAPGRALQQERDPDLALRDPRGRDRHLSRHPALGRGHLALRRRARHHLARDRAAPQLARRPDLRRQVPLDAVLDLVRRPPARRLRRRLGGRRDLRRHRLLQPGV